jgi:tetratricopeptide (TPR) repeat protein
MALLIGVGTGLVGCKAPMGGLAFWNKDDSSFASSAPDVGRQKYDGLAQEFGAKSGASTPLGGQPPADVEGPIASSWNKTTTAIASAFTLKPKVETDDPTSLLSKTGKVSSDVYVSAGRLLESQNKLADAQQKYEEALKVAPNDLTALVSLARLHDRQGRGQQAIDLYKKAIKAHPRTALVHNDLGLCYARQQQWQPAIQSLNAAIGLQPANPKYRNNMATVLVELGRPDDALKQLTAVNSEAIAHYNLAYLLQQKKQSDQAISHLQQAIAKDPSLSQAHEMLAQLGGHSGSSGYASAPSETRIAAQPVSTPVYREPAIAPEPQYQPPTQPPAGPGYHIEDEGIRPLPPIDE